MLRSRRSTILAVLAAVVLMTGLVAAVPHGKWLWTIDKTGDATEITLAPGQTFTVHYTVTVRATWTDVGPGFIDDCIELSDPVAAASPWTICVPIDSTTGAFPNPFETTRTYSRLIGPYTAEQCGAIEVPNTASFVTVVNPTPNPLGASTATGATGSDGHLVVVDVPCEGGCTLTPGYWKTHSEYGPAPYDDTWALIGEGTAFFSSGKTYYQALWTPPRGNAYYILAHAYIAAKLNLLNDASPTAEVTAAMAWAEAFFTGLSPSPPISGSLRAQALSYASLLDRYNNGDIGPGHCSEDSSSK